MRRPSASPPLAAHTPIQDGAPHATPATALYVVAFDPPQRDGKLWLAIGLREQFGFRDIWTYHDTLTDVRAFHEVSDQPLPALPALLDFLSLLVRLFNPTPPA